MKSRLILLAAIAITATAAVALLFWNPEPTHELVGSSIPGRPSGGNFTLNSADGPVSLSDYKGKVVVLYFGYTYCPDICPTSLALFSNALSQLSKKQIADIQPIFISVDPERDTLDRLKLYAKYFHQNFIGITGSSEAIKQAADLYGAAYRRVEQESATGYIVDHSAYLYLVDKQGKLADSLPHGTPSRDIHTALLKLL